jgi:hypothetical protein
VERLSRVVCMQARSNPAIKASILSFGAHGDLGVWRTSLLSRLKNGSSDIGDYHDQRHRS